MVPLSSPLRLAFRCHSLLIRRVSSTVNGEIIRQTSSEGKEINRVTKSLRVDAVAAAGLAISRRYASKENDIYHG